MITIVRKWLFSFLVVVCSVTISAFSLHTYEQLYMDSYKREIQSVLQLSISHASSLIAQQQQGLLTTQEAQEEYLRSVNTFNKGAEYIWANDEKGIARAHIRSEILGTYQKSYVRHSNALQNADIVFETRGNLKPLSNVNTLKINGVTAIPQWQWIIGYGKYLDELQAGWRQFFLVVVLINVVFVFLIFFSASFVNKRS